MVRWLLLCLVLCGTTLSQLDHGFEEDELFENIDKPSIAVESPAVKTLEPRAINSEAPEQNGDDKFQIYVGTIDGVRRIVFNEVEGQDEALKNSELSQSGRDFFGAYDDNAVVDQNQEKGIFIPRPYRPKEERDRDTTTTTTTTTRTTTTQRPTTHRTFPTAPPTRPTTQPPPLPLPTVQPQQPRRPFRPEPLPTVSQTTFQRPQPVPQVAPPQPPRVNNFQPFPQQAQTQRTRRPPFRPPQPTPAPQQFQNNFQQQNQFQQRPQVPQQPQQPFQPAPLQPNPNVPQTTPAPPPPFAQNRNPGDLRSGQCTASIFYISTPITGPTRLTFTHFAIAVTVDQCARTCHEFNCAIAHYNPINGHCEFNPSTSFAIRNGQCPAWPSLHYRNNVVASEPVRIFCVTCQRPRRRDPNRARNRFQLRQRVFDPRQQRQQQQPARTGVFNSRPTRGSEVSESSGIPVIHGVLMHQHTSSATGLSTSQFVSLSKPGAARAKGSTTYSLGGAQSVASSPVELEEGESVEEVKGGKVKAAGVVTRRNEEPIAFADEENDE